MRINESNVTNYPQTTKSIASILKSKGHIKPISTETKRILW